MFFHVVDLTHDTSFANSMTNEARGFSSATQMVALSNGAFIYPTNGVVVARPLTSAQLARGQKAERRARRLFGLLFGHDGFAQISKSGFMEIRGHSGTMYRISLRSGVDFDAPGAPTEGLCVDVVGVCPWDRLVALALLLCSGEAGEREFRARANARRPFNLGQSA